MYKYNYSIRVFAGISRRDLQKKPLEKVVQNSQEVTNATVTFSRNLQTRELGLC